MIPRARSLYPAAESRQLGDEVLQLLVDAEEERSEGLKAFFVPGHQAGGCPGG